MEPVEARIPPAVPVVSVDSSGAVLQSIRMLQLDREFSDCAVVAPLRITAENGEAVEEERFDCHRAVLASASHYFADALKAPGSVIHFRDINADEIKMVINFIYTGHADIPEEKVFRVYEASSRLGVNPLSDGCAAHLVGRAIEGNMDLFERLDIGLRLAEPRLVQPCMEELLVEDSTQLNSDRIFVLSEKSMRLLLLSEDLQVDEAVLFRALLRWGEAKRPRSVPLGDFLQPYLPLVRYAQMTVEEIENEVRIHDFVPRDLLLDAALALCKNPADWDISKTMFRQRNSIFVHRWKIDWQAVKDIEEVWSEPFSFYFAGIEHRWRLLMYPNGKNMPKYISFFLYLDTNAPHGEKFDKSVDFDFLLTDFSKRKRTQFFAKEPSVFSMQQTSWGFTKFRERSLIEKPNSNFMKNGYVEFELAMKMHSVTPGRSA